MSDGPKPVSSSTSRSAASGTRSAGSSSPVTGCHRPAYVRPGARLRSSSSMFPCSSARKTQHSTRSGLTPLTGGLETLEPLDRQHEHRRAADFDLERVRHEELAWLHDRRHRIDDLGPRRAVLAHDVDDLVDLAFVDADHDRRVRLLEEPARAVEAGGAVLPFQQRVDEDAGVLVVDDRDDELHAGEYRRGPRGGNDRPGARRGFPLWR